MPTKAKQSRDNDVQASIQATIVKKCSRVAHRPETNKACASGRCQHTCEPAQVEQCPHKWTVRYSVDSVQHEESFAELDQVQAFQLKLSSGKREEGKMFVDPRAGVVPFLPLAIAFIGNLPRAGERAKEVYRSNMRNPAVVALLQGRSVREVAVMEDEVTELLNVTIGGYQDEYRCTVRRVISDTLDQCVRRGMIPRHMLGGIELGPRVVSAEQYEKEQERRALVYLTDEQVRLLADGTQATRAGRKGPQLLQGFGISAWLMRTMGLRIRESLGVRKSDFKTRPDGTRYLHLCWQASTDGRKLVPLKHRKAGDYRDVPVPEAVWNMVQARPDGPVCPGLSTAYLPYSTAHSRFMKLMGHLGIVGPHPHALRHQFASEALDQNPRELANISKVLGHKSIEETPRHYIHASADPEQRVSALMNARWPGIPAAPKTAPKARGRALKAVA